MDQQKSEQEKIPTTKGIMAWVKEILHLNAHEIEEMPSPPSPEVITTLISKASGDPDPENPENAQPPTDNAKRTTPNAQRKTENAQRTTDNEKTCPYALRRNIVESLRVIREFAEKHDLAATMVRALLTLLAEMALGALKGKVSGTILEALLKIFNYERMKEEADLRSQLDKEEILRVKEESYRLGEIAGRNARISREIFPEQPAEVPDLKGTPVAGGSEKPDIFSMARQA